MNELEMAVDNCRKLITRKGLSQRVMERYFACLNSLLKTGKRENITSPCQKIFDIFITESSTKDAMSVRKVIVRMIDRDLGLNTIDKNGFLFNIPELIGDEELKKIFDGKLFPIDGSCTHEQIIAYVLSLMKDSHGDSTYGQYLHAFNFLRSWLIINKQSIFSRNDIAEYLDTVENDYSNGKLLSWVYKIRKRSANILLDVSDTGVFRWRTYTIKKTVPVWQKELFDKYLILYDEHTSISKATADIHRYVFSEVITALNIEGYDDFKKLERKNFELLCSKFHDKFNQNSIGTLYPVARKITTFLYDCGLLKTNYAFMFMKPNIFREYNPCLISSDDEKRLVAFLDSCSLRNKAMMLLAIRYGLRDSDICKLRFDEIDWNRETISIRQKKTGEPLILPLLTDVGNAIADYVKKERPDYSCPYIFLSAQRPYRKIRSAYSMCSGIMEHLDIHTSNSKGKGIHVFRYTLAKRLLEAQIPHQVITDSLGHRSNESDKYYYSIDSEKLRMCCLDTRWIGVKTWK